MPIQFCPSNRTRPDHNNSPGFTRMGADASRVRVGYKNRLPERMIARSCSRQHRRLARARKCKTRCYSREVPRRKPGLLEALLGRRKDGRKAFIDP